MNKQILVKLAAWWDEMPEDALDEPVKSYAKLNILASAVPELLEENARLRAIIDEFMGLEGRQEIPAELFACVRKALSTLPL
jgi:hypothetical protein